MTLLELIEEAHEKTHLDQVEILAIVRTAWPGRNAFTPTQARLLVCHIERRTERGARL